MLALDAAPANDRFQQCVAETLVPDSSVQNGGRGRDPFNTTQNNLWTVTEDAFGCLAGTERQRSEVAFRNAVTEFHMDQQNARGGVGEGDNVVDDYLADGTFFWKPRTRAQRTRKHAGERAARVGREECFDVGIDDGQAVRATHGQHLFRGRLRLQMEPLEGVRTQ